MKNIAELKFMLLIAFIDVIYYIGLIIQQLSYETCIQTPKKSKSI